MAIDTKKLLPPSKITSSLLAPNFSGLSVNKQSAEVRKVTELSKKYNEQNIDVMRKSLLDVDTLIKSVLTESKTTEENKRRRREKEEFEERESRLELPKEQKKFRLPQVSLPGMSFLDRVKRFLLFTGIGWLFTNFQSQLPKLLGIVKIITPIYTVVDNVFKFILSTVVNFIERGYETYDKIRSLVKSVGGEKAQQDFDALSSKLNEYINYVLIGGMALTGAITAFATNVSKIRPPQPKPKPVPAPARPAAVGGGKSVVPSAANAAKSGGKLAQKALAKNFIRTAVKPVLARLPIVGALIEFGLSWALGDPVSKAAFRGVGSLLVGAVGTAIGGPIGTAIGGLIGGEVGGRVYDVLFGGNKPSAYKNGGRVIKAYAKGGGVLGTYELGRTIRVERSRKPSPPVQPTVPGSDVGGTSEIQRIYPSPMDFRKPNPYDTLTDTARDLKSVPYGFGALMGGAVDIALGQKMSNSTILNASVGLENMFYDNYDRNENYIDVRSIIFGVIKSAADSALMNIRDELNKGKRKEEEKPADQTQTSTRSQPPSMYETPGSPGGVEVSGSVVGYVGSTGKSSGPHIHIETGDGYGGKGGGIPENVLSSIIVDGKPLSQHPRGDGLGAGRGHQGFDYPIRDGAPIVLKGGLKFVEYDEGYNAGYGNSLIIADSSGRKYLIGHLSGGPSDPKKIKELQEKQKVESLGRMDDTSTSKLDESSKSKSTGPVPTGGTLNFDQLYNVALQAGFSDKNAKLAAAVALAESSGRSGVVRDTPDSGDLSYGLWQINMIGNLGPARRKQFGLSSNEQLLDPLTNAKAAYRISGGSNFSAWSAYKSGAHLKYLPKAKLGGSVDSISPSGNYVLPKDSSTDTKLLEQYPSYSEGGIKTRLAVQRVIVEKIKPVPMQGNSKTNFTIAGGGVNNTMALNRG